MADMTPEEITEFVNQSDVVKLFGEIDNDADAALTQAKRLMSNSALKLCSSATIKEYQALYKDTESAYADFNDELSLCDNGKAKSLKPLETTYETLMYALELVEESNVAFQGVVDAKLGLTLTAFMNVLGQVLGYGGTFKKKQAELAVILKDLEKAKKKVMGSAAKTSINAAITAGSLLAGPVGMGARLGVAVAPQVIGLAIDAATDKASPPTALKGTYDLGTGAIDVSDKLKGPTAKAFSAFTTVLNTALDVKDTADTIKLKKDLDKKLTAFMKEFKKAQADFEKQTKDLIKALADAKKAFDAAVKAANSFKSREARRKSMMRKF